MSDNFVELSKIQNEAIQKYTYFLLAAAGAAIGYSLTKTDDKLLGWNLLPLGLSELSWALSFFCGCRYLTLDRKANFANLTGLKVASEQPMNQVWITTVMEFTEKKFNEIRDRSELFGLFQFLLFAIGVMVYIFWYILELYIKTYPTSELSTFFKVS